MLRVHSKCELHAWLVFPDCFLRLWGVYLSTDTLHPVVSDSDPHEIDSDRPRGRSKTVGSTRDKSLSARGTTSPSRHNPIP
jgi:hypothetical protein